MIRADKKRVALAVCLSTLAGYVDAIGFISMGGFFVSFMSGNSTRLGVALSAGEAAVFVIPAAIISLFVLGVVIGSFIGHAGKAARLKFIMAFVTLMLAAAAALCRLTGRQPTVAAMVVAMGAINTLFERDGEVNIAVTYMTGTLVKMGQGIAAAFLGGSRTTWLRYFFLWLGLVLGACLGAAAYMHIGLTALWFAAAWALGITAWVGRQGKLRA